jgi:hypothetical protein
MNKMKKTFRLTFILATLISILYSCNPDDNSDQPTADPRDKFVGSWLCNETSTQNGNSSYTATISLNSGNSSQIYINNFYGSLKVYGVVANLNVTLPQQTVNSFTIHGSGTMGSNNTKINMNYWVDTGADIDTCTAVYSK